MKLGIDFGRVIMEAAGDSVQADTSFLGSSFNDAMRTPASTGSIDSIRELVDVFAGEVWIVSKCGPSVEQKTRAWLSKNDFYGATGLNKENLRFCRQRNEKAGICRKLGIGYFVDDRIDVLSHMVGVVPHLYLFGQQSRGTECPDYAVETSNWEVALARILEDVNLVCQKE